MGKNGNSQKPGEPTGKPQEAKKSEQFQLLIFGKGITKIISSLANTSCELFDRSIKSPRSIRVIQSLQERLWRRQCKINYDSRWSKSATARQPSGCGKQNL